MRWFWLAIVLGVLLLGLALGSPAAASAPTPTWTPTPVRAGVYDQQDITPMPTNTAVYLGYGNPILLPTGWIPVKTHIPVRFTPAPGQNPLGLNIDMGEVLAEGLNMNQAVEDMIGPANDIIDFLVTVLLGILTMFYLFRVIYRARYMTLQPEQRVEDEMLRMLSPVNVLGRLADRRADKAFDQLVPRGSKELKPLSRKKV